MAKKKISKSMPVMSPEKYIRNNSRNLPIAMCRINQRWEEDGLANLLIVREHKSGNFTACLYLVDLLCLGVKDTMFFFNETRSHLDKFLQRMEETTEIVDISYDLAHNIIFEAIEFAGNYGFLPHKDFTRTTSFFLEEDNEAIPMIEIKCGRDGKPFYVNTGHDSPFREKQIMSQLEKTAGKGNFDFVLPFDGNPVDDDSEDKDIEAGIFQDIEALREELALLDYEQKKDLFIEYVNGSENVSFADYKKGVLLTEMLADEVIDEEKYDSLYDEFYNLLYVEDVAALDDLPNSFCEGVPEDKEEIVELYFKFDESDNEKVEKKLAKEIRKLAGDIPLSNLCDLFLSFPEKDKYQKLLKELIEKFPHYPMFKLLEQNQLIGNKIDEEEREKQLECLNNMFLNRDKIAFVEYDQWVFNYISFLINPEKPDLDADLELIAACMDIIVELDISENKLQPLTLYLRMCKRLALVKYFLHE